MSAAIMKGSEFNDNGAFWQAWDERGGGEIEDAFRQAPAIHNYGIDLGIVEAAD